MRFKHLYRTFFTQLLQTFLQLLHFQRVFDANAAKQLRCKKRNAGKSQHFAFGKAVANLNIAVVGNADNIARKRFFHQLAVVRHKRDHAGGGNFAV